MPSPTLVPLTEVGNAMGGFADLGYLIRLADEAKGTVSPAARNFGFTAAREARAKFDKRNPEADFESWKKARR